MSTDATRMKQLLEEFCGALDKTSAQVYEMAAVAAPDGQAIEGQAVIDPEMSQDILIDVFASLFWIFVAESSFDAQQTAIFLDMILNAALSALVDNTAEGNPDRRDNSVNDFRELADSFVEELRENFGNVKGLVGIVWGDESKDTFCSTESASSLTEEELAPVLASFVISLMAHHDLNIETGHRVLENASLYLDKLCNTTGGDGQN